MNISPNDFGASFKGFLDQMSASAPVEEPIFRRRLREHFECEPNELPTLSEKFPTHDHANVHSALEAEFAGADCSVATFGVNNPHPVYERHLVDAGGSRKGRLDGGWRTSRGPRRIHKHQTRQRTCRSLVFRAACFSSTAAVSHWPF